ncbi:UvrD-helicase domain-containing protein [Patescibacteria group bacterium]|nr:UvrD-helicase domain-containing protein [Patescibacteria group bacterium]
MSKILKDLNEKQLEAVKATSGPVLILAGAGSGKTRALTNRVAYLIQEKNISPYNVLAVTFTNKAANEMKLRILKLLHPDFDPLVEEIPHGDLPTVGTFHSVCVQILRKHIHLLGFENRFIIYDANDQVVLMKEIMRDHHIDEKQLNPKAVLAHISGAKNQLQHHEDYALRAHNYFTEKVAELYQAYQNRLARNQALDFDDLIMKTVDLFNQHPEILDHYQERFRFISVDEYQDTNHAQYVLISLLAAKYRNICVIGDPDQSIYSWRGANMQNILDFEKDYPEALVIKLEQNYRSSPRILEAAHAIITKNIRRKEKNLWTDRTEGALIRLWQTRDERDEAFRIAQEIQSHTRRHESPDYREFAVLYRTNAQSRVLEEAFMRYGIPYRIVGGVKFYLRKEIKDLIAYLRVTQNPDDDVSLLRIINTPTRGIGSKTIFTLQEFAAAHQISIWAAFLRLPEISDLASKEKPLKAFADLILSFQKIDQEFAAAGVLKHIISQSGYRDFLLKDKLEGETRYENVKELISVADKYEALEPGISLATFLEEISLISDLDTLDDRDNAVTLMTLHSAKGLEFPIVFISGLEEGIFPHSRSLIEPHELEEERRLMYVGITRAMDHLYLLHARQRMLYGEFKQSAPSQFLLDIPEELIEGSELTQREHRSFGDRPVPVEDEMGLAPGDLKDGDRVRHKTFGEGVVISVSGGIVTVAFKDKKVGIKKLALSIAPLEKI